MLNENEEIINILKEENYYSNLKELEDGSIVGIGDLLFTYAIYTNISLTGYENRYCFNEKEKAIEELLKLKDQDSEPVGYIAKRITK